MIEPRRFKDKRRSPSASRQALLATWVPDGKDWSTHSVVVNRDATRAYVSIKRMQDDRKKASNPNGLAILDITAGSSVRDATGISAAI